MQVATSEFISKCMSYYLQLFFPNNKVLTKVSVSLEAKKKVYDSKKILSRSRTKLNEISQICSLLTRFCSSKLCSNKMILLHMIYTITFTWGMKFSYDLSSCISAAQIVEIFIHKIIWENYPPIIISMF